MEQLLSVPLFIIVTYLSPQKSVAISKSLGDDCLGRDTNCRWTKPSFEIWQR